MKELQINKGFITIVDDEDYEYLSKYNWKVNVTSGKEKKYVMAGTIIEGRYKTLVMHRLIMNAPKFLYVDHINGDGLDNRKCNLRICTSAENNRNKKISSYKRSSKYKGVYGCAKNKWYASITIHGVKHHLGNFSDEKKAALAYNEAAIKYHGEFARLNDL